jgi:transposase
LRVCDTLFACPNNDARKLVHRPLESIGIRAVEQVQSGEMPEVVSEALGFARDCIYNCLQAYRAGGLDALRPKPLKARPKNITKRQMMWIYNAVTLKSPMRYKYKFAISTLGMIGTLIDERFGIHLSLSSVGSLLVQLGLTCQKELM